MVTDASWFEDVDEDTLLRAMAIQPISVIFDDDRCKQWKLPALLRGLHSSLPRGLATAAAFKTTITTSIASTNFASLSSPDMVAAAPLLISFDVQGMIRSFSNMSRGTKAYKPHGFFLLSNVHFFSSRFEKTKSYRYIYSPKIDNFSWAHRTNNHQLNDLLDWC